MSASEALPNGISGKAQNHNGSYSVEGTTKSKNNDVPELPHVTNNIIPLSNILKFYTQEAYKQLVTIIENLSTTCETESDSTRKKKFLDLIISLRQDFIKIYTLVKWSSNSKDVSKLIDLLNWFRTQEFYFENLGYGLNELNRYSGAKLPNSDIITALEVFIKGRPQLPSYNIIKSPRISSERILEVLEDLNLVLATRMALSNNIPERFINNHEIRDGRIYFTIPNEFQVSVTVANDLIVEDTDYHKSPYYFIDFEFLFGINPETSLITHKFNKVITKLPKSSHENLEKVVNKRLATQGLSGMYDLLHKYSISFKLYLIARQLRDISVNTKWRGNIQFKYENGKSLIIINYWCSHYLSKNWKSFIELGIDKFYNLNFRWFKNGKYNLDHGIKGLFGNENVTDNEDGTSQESEELSVDLILNLIVNKHSELLVGRLYEKLKEVFTSEPEICSYINPNQLSIKISSQKSTILCINPLTGFFYFVDPSPLENKTSKIINSQPLNRNAFFSEKDMITNIVNCIISLRLDTFNYEINNKLVTTHWISNDLIKLNDLEVIKLFADKEFRSNHIKIQFYRRKNWPSSWFLVSLISGITTKADWWVARIKSIKGDWKLQWIQKLTLEHISHTLNYEFFLRLSTMCSNLILDHMILEELHAREIRFIKAGKIDELLGKFNIDINHKQKGSSSLAYESTIILYNDNLLPIKNSSSSLFLQAALVSENNITQLQLIFFGNIRNLPLNHLKKGFLNLNLVINEENEYFQLSDTVNLSQNINENSSTSNSKLLENIFNDLNKMQKTIKILDQFNKNNLEVISNTNNEITVKIDKNLDNLVIKMPDNANDTIKLYKDKSNEKLNTFTDLDLILIYLNRYLEDEVNENIILGIIRYLKEIMPILSTHDAVKKNIKEFRGSLPNELSKLNYDLKVPYLNLFQFVFYLNYTNNNSLKKIFKDKIMINISFKVNKFSKSKKNLISISMKDNLNAKNLKYKKLFEIIFKLIDEFEIQTRKTKSNAHIIKLNYEFLVEPSLLQPIMLKVAESFTVFLQNEK